MILLHNTRIVVMVMMAVSHGLGYDTGSEGREIIYANIHTHTHQFITVGLIPEERIYRYRRYLYVIYIAGIPCL